MKYTSLLIVLFLFLGCANTKVNQEDIINKTKNEVSYEKDFKAVKDSGKVDTSWVKSFNDPSLEKLTQEALLNNRELRVLKTQVDRANILVDKAASQLKPTVDLKGAYNSRNTDNLSEVSLVGLNVRWEADVWGRLGLDKEAAKQNAKATESDYEYARQYLLASTAKAWFTLTTSKKQFDYSSKIVALYEKELDIMEKKLAVGFGEKRDVYRAKSNLNTAKNAKIEASNAYENAQRSLEVILGRYPAALIKANNELLAIPDSIPSGIPSEILERRPDLVAAQQRVAAAFYKQKSSVLLHLPTFKFSVGASITSLSDAVADLVAGIFAPLYTGGAIEAEVAEASILQKQAIENYAQKALLAFKEVENNLSLEQRLLDQENYLRQIVADNKKSFELTKISYEVGKVEYLEVSDSIEKLVGSEISLLDIANKRLQNRINLHLSLGGGF